MACSPAQLSANRKNAQRSKGPGTEAGKSRSRRNALKHGLTGDGVVLPDEDSAAVQERFETFEADLKPKNGVAQVLVRRAAMLSVRMERCVRHESAELTLDMLKAEGAEADERADELARLFATIGEDPSGVVRKLERSPEGIDWMIRSWEALKSDLLDRTIQRWLPKHRERAEHLSGNKPDGFGFSRIAALSCAIDGNFRLLAAGDWPDLPSEGRREAARVELAAVIDSEVARLNRVREGLDHEAIALAHAGAPARARFGTSREAVLARKYEATAERGFYQALKQIEEQNAAAEAEDASEVPDEGRDEVERSDESGSFFQEPADEQTPTVESREPALGRPSRGRRTELQPTGEPLDSQEIVGLSVTTGRLACR